jgi:hypothetical protein
MANAPLKSSSNHVKYVPLRCPGLFVPNYETISLSRHLSAYPDVLQYRRNPSYSFVNYD